MHGDVSDKVWRWLGVLALVWITGCERKAADSSTTALQAPLGSDRLFSFESVMRGARLYQEHCAQCHGPEAQGHPDWENPQVAAAPPLNGTGNEWKRPKTELIAVIKNGVKRGNDPVMPGWNGRLSPQEMEDIVSWFQALWPLDVYDRWVKVNNGQPVPETKTGKSS
jgi:mono/diheme cytochrome c family protein